MGSSLRHVIDAHAPLRPARAIGLAIQILDRLAALHEAGRPHGAISPEVIVVVRDQAELRAPAGPADARYAAPDAGGRKTPSSDVFSVGCILYELLTRTLPDAGAPAPSSRTPSRLGARLDATVMRAVAPAAADRFATAAELLQELRVCLVEALGDAARARET